MPSNEIATPVEESRIKQAKVSYTTRLVPLGDMSLLITGNVKPEAGDLVLARIKRLGHHKKIELPRGRRAHMYAGDEIIVVYGNRYAPDQFEAVVGNDLAPCHLVAAGGIAGTVRSSSDGTRKPTRIIPLGLLGHPNGRRLNIRDYTLRPLPARRPEDRRPTLAVIGTSMNAGKTTTASHLIRGLTRAGHRVGAAKVTGTGAGGDRWQMMDAGASTALDFTDVGHASTYLLSPREVEDICETLLNHLAHKGADVIVVEIADGLFQKETAALLGSTYFRDNVDGILFAATDAVSAAAGYQWLTAQSLPLIAVSGCLTRSPLAIREAESWAGVPVLRTSSLSDPAMGARLWTPVLNGSLSEAATNIVSLHGDDADREAV